MVAVLLLLLRHRAESPIFALAFASIVLAVIIGVILWERRYRRVWQQFRARNWQQVAGKFDDGEIVTMRKGRSGNITGYQLWLGYEYEANIGEVGLYTLPYFGEFPNEEEARKCLKLVANRDVTVRVSPRHPKRSCVLDEDVKPLVEGG